MKTLLRPFLIALTTLALLATGLQAQVATKKVVTLELAKKLTTAARKEAQKNNWTMAIAIVDDGGNLVCFERMDGTQLGSIDVALQKAKTSAFFKRPTKAFEETIMTDKRTIVLSVPNVIAIEGGLPVIVDGVQVGAIGVSGAKPAEDGLVAKAAIEAVLNAP